jgi:hypothetical protein
LRIWIGAPQYAPAQRSWVEPEILKSRQPKFSKPRDAGASMCGDGNHPERHATRQHHRAACSLARSLN